MAKVAITVNGAESKNVFPPFILGSSAVSLGDEVNIFFCPGGAEAMVKGAVEKMQGKGLPNLAELVEGVRALGGKIYVCELALTAKDLKKEDFRDGVEIIGATTFMDKIKDATITFSF
ncbi:MAG: DsrE/DsrF/DrsH-like family protein [Candidatus Aminicenantes bacterium]|nr:DsrE/DsrF/DrsH-like family protein [Candidatus Aminicenantes bacterium]